MADIQFNRHPLVEAVAVPVCATVVVFLIPHLPPGLAWVNNWILETGTALMCIFLAWAVWSLADSLAGPLEEKLGKWPPTARVMAFLDAYGFQAALAAAGAYGLASVALADSNGAGIRDLLFILIVIQLYILVIMGYRIVDVGGRGVGLATVLSVVMVVGIHVAGKTVYFLLQQALDGTPYAGQIRGVLYGSLMIAPLLLVFSYAGSISARRANRGSQL